jgi:hypothetical protein
MKKIPIYNLRSFERLWMQEVYKDFQANRRSNNREIWSRLYGKIPINFRPAAMSHHLISSDGERLTILGVIALEKSTDILKEVDAVINAIKEMILKNHLQEVFTAEEISEKTGMPTVRIGLLLSLASNYGNFWRGASCMSENSIALKLIEIGRDDNVYYQYIRFHSMEETILLYLEEEAYRRKKDQQFLSSNSPVVIEQEEDGYLRIRPIFSAKVPKVNPRICFVLMPFVKEWSERVYKDLIRKNVEYLNLQCLRADKLTGQNIVEDIWTSINQAAFIIADVTGTNPNVMYELGIAHTLGKPTILITQDVSNIPFDFRHLRHIEYKEHTEGVRAFNKRLKIVIKELYGESYPGIEL